MKQLTVNGDSADIRGDTVDLWKERLPEIISGYTKENIWKMDETGGSIIYQIVVWAEEETVFRLWFSLFLQLE